MQVHAFGVQVGITKDLSAMVGVPYVIKERKAVTFKGRSGTTELGTFQNETSGIGDIAAAGGVVAERVAELTASRRFPPDSRIGRIAAAIRSGDADAATAVLTEPGTTSGGGDGVELRVVTTSACGKIAFKVSTPK